MHGLKRNDRKQGDDVKTIVLVEADTDTAHAISVLLENHGYQVALCRQSTQLLPLLETSDSHAVILDPTIERDAGWLALIDMRSIKKFASLPLIVLCDKDQELMRSMAYKLGADHYLVKYPETEELLSVLNGFHNQTVSYPERHSQPDCKHHQ